MSVSNEEDAHGDERPEGAAPIREHPDNTAGRLHATIKSLGSAPRTPGILTSAQVCKMLGADPEDFQQLREFGLRYLMMIAEVRTGVAKLPPRKNREPLLRHLPEFEDLVISLFFRAPARFVSFPNSNAMYGLEMCAEALDEYEIGQPSMPKTETADLIRLVQDLMAAIRADEDLTPEAKALLLDRLLDVEKALMYIDVLGMDGLQAAVDRLVGSSLAFPEAQKPRFVEWLGKPWRAVHHTAISAKEISDAGNAVVTLTKAITGHNSP